MIAELGGSLLLGSGFAEQPGKLRAGEELLRIQQVLNETEKLLELNKVLLGRYD